MPTYDYQCQKCGYEFEIFQGMLEQKLKTCPKCRGRVQRLIGAGAGIVFKGSGFYQTDYRSSDYRKRATEESKSGSGSKSEGKGAKESTNKSKESTEPKASKKKPEPGPSS